MGGLLLALGGIFLAGILGSEHLGDPIGDLKVFPGESPEGTPSPMGFP